MYTPDKDYQHMLDKLNILRKQKIYQSMPWQKQQECPHPV